MAILHAERRSAKAAYRSPWSPTLMKMGQEQIFWTHRCSDFRRYSDSLASIPDISTLVTRPDYASILNNRFSLSHSLNNLHAARYSLDECHLSAAQLRHNHFTEHARHTAITSDPSVETAFNSILTAEAAITTFWKRKKCAKGEIRSSLQRVEVPVTDSNQNPTGQTLSITEPTNLFAAITAQNISHFSQAMDTPSVSGTLGTFIPPLMRNESTISNLQGSYNPTNIEPMPEICQFRQAMAIPPELQDTDPVNIAISTIDFQKGFKKLPDTTSSSPSGRHMTHYKLLAKDKGLSHILARAITLPFQHGFSPTRWCTAIQFMLKKKRKSSHHQTQSGTAPRDGHELRIPPTVEETSCTSCPCTKCSHTTQLWGQARRKSPQCTSTQNTLI